MGTNTAPVNVFDADLPTLEYSQTETPLDMYPRVRTAQEAASIAIGPYGPEVLSHRLVRAVLRDDRFGIPPGVTLLLNGVDSGPVWDKVTSSLLCMEGDQHRRLRSLVSKAFTPRATARLSGTIDEVLNELIDKVAAKGECEFVADIARPYPVPIICSLIGAPREDWAKFSLWTDAIFRAFSYSYSTENDEQAVVHAWSELDNYIDDMVASRRHSLTDDLLSDLIRAEDHGDQLNDAELRMLVGGLLMAGTDTTRNQVAASAHILCQHPEQWALLRQKPELAMNAVEETMRHRPIANSLMRTALNDVELDGYLIPRNTFVFVNTFAANRDPEIYEDPDRFDITREVGSAVLSFGAGVHYCLGSNLARLELASALRILTTRMPNARLSGPAPWGPMTGISGPIVLPITFDGGH